MDQTRAVFNDFERSNAAHVSIDLKKLASSLRGEFETLTPLSQDCCIFHVPSHIRMLNATYYTPRIVSIGPIHHHRLELKELEKDKLRYLKQFMEKTRLTMMDFLRFIKFKESKLRAHYSEIVKYESEEFVKMVLIDAVFLIEIFLRFIPEFQNTDRVFTNPGLIKDIVFDILLLENQIPIFIIEELFVLSKLQLPEKFQRYQLSHYVCAFFDLYVCQAITLDATLIGQNFSNSKHFVDLLWLSLKPPYKDYEKRKLNSEEAPNITKLYQFGMKFKVVLDKGMLDITYDASKKTLEIPRVIMSNMTVHLLRNLQVFESLYHREENYINDYNVILNRFLSTSEDVEILIRKGVIDNRILDSGGVSRFFQELGKDARVHREKFQYLSVVSDLQKYCGSRRNEWKAFFKQNYLSNPWIIISVIAAFIVLCLTFLQTLFTIASFYQR